MGKPTAESATEGLDLSQYTILVTGGTNGVGKETVRVLAKRKARVFLGARNLTLAEKVKEDIVKEIPGAKIDLLKIDLSSLESVRTAAQEFLALNVPLNVLVCNAGISSTKLAFSVDGLEMDFATNYLGHVLLTEMLLEKLKATATESGMESRIVNVSSQAYEAFVTEGGIKFDELRKSDKTKGEGKEMGLSAYMKLYSQSKLAQILYTKERAKRLQDEGVNNVTINCIHPGVVRTNINAGPPSLSKTFSDVMFRLIGVNVAQGAYNQTYVAVNPEVKGVTGQFFFRGKVYKLKQQYALDDDLQTKLWDYSMKLISA